MIIDGRSVSKEIELEIEKEIKNLNKRPPCLAVLLVGDDPPSHIYVNRKAQACERVGMKSIIKKFPATISEEKLLLEIKQLNNDPLVDGILVQLPLPRHINSYKITWAIDPKKDVDGFHPLNVGKMLIGSMEGFLPCTPLAVYLLMKKYGISASEKHIVVLGRSNIVGKPMAALFMQRDPERNATVTIVHRLSPKTAEICQSADIIICALGIPHYITEDMVKEGAAVFDIGINKVNGKVVGDVDFDRVKDKCSFITPVPGGVGPMTIATLLSNTLKSYHNHVS